MMSSMADHKSSKRTNTNAPPSLSQSVFNNLITSKNHQPNFKLNAKKKIES